MGLGQISSFSTFIGASRQYASAFGRTAGREGVGGGWDAHEGRKLVKFSDKAISQMDKVEAKVGKIDLSTHKGTKKLDKLQHEIQKTIDKLQREAAKVGIQIVIEDDLSSGASPAVPDAQVTVSQAPESQVPVPAAAPQASSATGPLAPPAAAPAASSKTATGKTTTGNSVASSGARQAAVSGIAAGSQTAAGAVTAAAEKLTGQARAAVSGNKLGLANTAAQASALEKVTGQAKAAASGNKLGQAKSG